jgi:hypothetical protein
MPLDAVVKIFVGAWLMWVFIGKPLSYYLGSDKS